jgi:hypothetical protein
VLGLNIKEEVFNATIVCPGEIPFVDLTSK